MVISVSSSNCLQLLTSDVTGALRLVKKPAFWQGKFDIEQVGSITSRETMNLVLSFIMLVLLERRRG